MSPPPRSPRATDSRTSAPRSDVRGVALQGRFLGSGWAAGHPTPSTRRRRPSVESYDTRQASDSSNRAAVARWMASRVRSVFGSSRPARTSTRSLIRTSSTSARTCSARRRPTSPTWIIARATSALARALDTSTRRRRKRRRAGRLRLAYHQLDDRRGVDVGDPVTAHRRASGEHSRRRLDPRVELERLWQVVERPGRLVEVAGRPQLLEWWRLGNRSEQRDRPAAIGHLDGLTGGDPAQVFTGPLPQLTDTDRRHGATCSTFTGPEQPSAGWQRYAVQSR